MIHSASIYKSMWHYYYVMCVDKFRQLIDFPNNSVTLQFFRVLLLVRNIGKWPCRLSAEKQSSAIAHVYYLSLLILTTILVHVIMILIWFASLILFCSNWLVGSVTSMTTDSARQASTFKALVYRRRWALLGSKGGIVNQKCRSSVKNYLDPKAESSVQRRNR